MTEKRLTKWGAELKKIISIILAAVIFILPLTVHIDGINQNAEAASIDFKCGDNVTWYLDTNGVLTISGTGDMYDYLDSNLHSTPPWNSFNSSIYRIVIEEGVTSIGDHAFSFCRKATSVSISSTVEIIGSFAFNGVVESISVAPNSKLREADTMLITTEWFKNQPTDSPVYLGNMLYKLDRTSKLTSLEIREGTYAINTRALNSCDLEEIIFPNSIAYIGSQAFEGTDWLRNLPDGPVYIGKTFFVYNGSMALEEIDFTIKEGTVGISYAAFNGQDRMMSVRIPSSIEFIGASAFGNCTNLSEVIFDEESKVEYIGGYAFSDCDSLKNIKLPDSVRFIGECAFSYTGLSELHIPENTDTVSKKAVWGSDVREFTVDEDNPFFSVDEYGVLYSKNKIVLVMFPDESVLTSYTVNEACKIICGYAFYTAKITELNLNEGLEQIGSSAFEYTRIKEITFPDSVFNVGSNLYFQSSIKTIKYGKGITEVGQTAFNGIPSNSSIYFPRTLIKMEKNAFLNVNNPTIYCFENSYAHIYAIENEIAYVLLEEETDINKLEKLIAQADLIDRSLFTEESLEKLDAAIGAVDIEADTLTQEQIDLWCGAINAAMNELEYKPADFSAIDDVKIQAEAIDRTIYTLESLEELDKAISAVDYDLTIDKQSQITEWVSAIESAISNLKYKSADYSAVEAEISKANAIDRRYYSEISLISLDAAINSVDYSLNITEQDKVNGYAQAIANAISALEYASIVLRHEPCGVIVSATTKEIKPDTLLAVEEVDPSNYEGTNFAVGGSIRSLHFYDINLVYETVIVQPDGTVTVKIKLADGVDPAKCKVYHVTEDIVNPLVRFASTIDGNYIVFETDHFSEFAVIEVETVLDSIEISTHPAKTEYIIGEQLDLTGMKVVAYYSDGTSKEVSDYNAGIVDMQTAGTKKVTVYYTFGTVTKSTDFNITVTGETKNVADIIIRSPSITTIKYGDSIWLHAKIEGELPSDAKIIWTPSNNNFEIVEVSADGMSCKITPKSSGTTTFTVSVVATDENVLATDSQDMTSKAGLWQKIVAFFKKIFGAAKTYPELYKKLF